MEELKAAETRKRTGRRKIFNFTPEIEEPAPFEFKRSRLFDEYTQNIPQNALPQADLVSYLPLDKREVEDKTLPLFSYKEVIEMLRQLKCDLEAKLMRSTESNKAYRFLM